MLLDRYAYVPLLRTREAELKGFEHLSGDILGSCLPVIELTRSRRSKNNPQGDIARNVERVSNLLKGRNFILDVSVEEEFSNAQTEALLDQNNSFGNWVQFVASLANDHIVPMIHLAEGMNMQAIEQEAARLSEHARSLAIRLDYSDAGVADVMASVYRAIPDPQRITVILDAGFIQTGSQADHDDLVLAAIDSICEVGEPGGIVCMSSSFPSSVKDEGYGGDSRGAFEMAEVLLTRLVKQQRPDRRLYHGDYSSIHPLRYPAAFGGWVPRIDVPLDDVYFYHRYRRSDGGYERAAREVLSDELYEDAGTWGDEQIAQAAEGDPEGRSPSHWIAVRVNIHISRQTRQWRNV